MFKQKSWVQPFLWIAAAAVLSVCASTVRAAALTVPVAVEIDQTMGRHVPVHASLDLPEQLRGVDPERILVTLRAADASEQSTAGQVVPAADGGYELWWIVEDAAEAPSRWQAAFSIGQVSANERFSWAGKPGDYLDLLYKGRPVTRYMYASDTSTEQRAFETFKVFHHVFDETGRNFITNGPGGRFPHHRGIYYGFNHLHYDGDQRDDWWHMRDGVRQEHYQFEKTIAGPVLARSTAVIHWNDAAGEPVVIERRTLTAFAQPLPTIALLDFESELTPARSDIRLAGDPEHAGVQYRACNYVFEETKDRTIYVFDDPDANAHRDRDMPWAAMRYFMRLDRPYTVQQMDHPTNPRETRFSAYRDYGRFGAFFVTDVAENESLTVRYRFWIANTGMPDRQDLRQHWNAFVHGGN